jgi:hypothetical protein
MPRKIREYERLKIISISEAFAMLSTGEDVTAVDGELVTTAVSLRLQTFMEKGLKCVHEGCVLTGSFFAIERSCRKGLDTGIGPFHLNLWAVDGGGDEILFTHDHIVARALGGPDTMDNAQTMCCRHNWKKAIKESKEVDAYRKAAAFFVARISLMCHVKVKTAMKLAGLITDTPLAPSVRKDRHVSGAIQNGPTECSEEDTPWAGVAMLDTIAASSINPQIDNHVGDN